MRFQLTSISHIVLVAALTGHSLAVFYTKGEDKDYPRIGRRSFYTPGSDNHYPRIGRRASRPVESADVNPRLLLLSGSQGGHSSAATSSSSGSGSSAAFSELAKRGVFTNGQHGYPRVGRRGAGISLDLLGSRRNRILERLAEFKDGAASMDADPDLASEEEVGEINSAHGASSFPLEIIFMAFDSDGRY